MWERFSFYGMQGILLIYMYFTVAEGGLGIDQVTATGIVGAYGGTVYLSTILGAWVADRILGSERVLFFSAIVIVAGHVALLSCRAWRDSESASSSSRSARVVSRRTRRRWSAPCMRPATRAAMRASRSSTSASTSVPSSGPSSRDSFRARTASTWVSPLPPWG